MSNARTRKLRNAKSLGALMVGYSWDMDGGLTLCLPARRRALVLTPREVEITQAVLCRNHAASGPAVPADVEMSMLVRQMIADLAALRVQVEAIKQCTSATAKILDRAMPDGDALRVRVIE